MDRFASILSGIVSVGEHEKVVQGIFENYPNTKYRDPSMRVVGGTEVASTIARGTHHSLVHLPVQCSYACGMCLHSQTARVLEWILFQDVVQQTIMSTQNYSLIRCLPFAAVAAHIHLATTGNPRIHYPHQQFEVCACIRGARFNRFL